MSTEKHPELLFDSNPPSSTSFIRDLFYNRENELSFGEDLLKNGNDFDKILAVHGETQVGKSHLVQRILLDVQLWRSHYSVFQVNANSRGSVDAVLEEILNLLRKAIEFFEQKNIPDGAHDIYEGAILYFKKIEPLLAHQAHEITFSLTQEELATFSTDVKLTLLPPKFLNLALGTGAQSQTKNGESTSVKLTKLSPSDLILHIQYTADVLRALDPSKKTLLFVDDLDLLDRSGAAGKEESHKLADHLKHLASMEAIVVITTIRHAYFNGRHKNFKDFLNVDMMEPESLLEVYQRHIKNYNLGKSVFAPETLDWLARSAEGKVGIFLNRLFQIWRATRKPAGDLITLADARVFIRKHIETLLKIPRNVAIVSAIIEAVKSRQVQVTIIEDLSDSELLNRVLHPERNNEYTIDSIYVDVIRDMESRPS